MWQIHENDFGQEVRIQDLSEYHKGQVPTRLVAWKSEYDKYN